VRYATRASSNPSSRRVTASSRVLGHDRNSLPLRFSPPPAHRGDLGSVGRLGSVASIFALHGNATLGGGTATIVEVEKHIIDERRWITREESHLAFAICRLTPGTNLLADCVGVGWRMRGVAGALVALAAASLPCAAIAVALTIFFAAWSTHRLTAIALSAVLAAAIGIMLGTAWTMIRPYIRRGEYARTAAFGVMAFAIVATGLSTPFRVLALAAIIGALTAPSETR
jgi:chromate transporter